MAPASGILTRCQAEDFLEASVQVALIAEACLVSGIGNRKAGSQQRACVLHAGKHLISVRRNANFPVEYPDEIVRAQAGLIRQGIEGHVRRWVGAHHGHPARLKDAVTPPQGKQSTVHLRIRFPRMPESETHLLENISWKEFWSAFEADRLAMEYVHEPADRKTIPMVRFVNRDTTQADNSALSDPAAYQRES